MAKGKYQKWLEPDGLLLLRAWARDGLTDVQIADKCDINPATLYDWKKAYPEIDEALKKGKEIVDVMVENALLKRAIGYEYQEVTIEETENGYKRRVATKQMAPDVTALIIWLKNRKPNAWRDKQPEGVDASVDNNHAPDTLLLALDRRGEEVWPDGNKAAE